MVLFRRFVISSSFLQLSMISVRRSVLFRRQASTSCSFLEAPYTHSPRQRLFPSR